MPAALANLTLALKIKPNCRHLLPLKRLTDTAQGEALYELAVNAPPIDGKANLAIIARLAILFDIPKSSITLTHGSTGRLKRVSIDAHVDTLARIKAVLAAATV